MFTATVFTIARTWTQTKCPFTDEWISRYSLHTHTHTHTHNEILLRDKKNEIGSFVTMWMEPESVIQSEVS